MSGSNLEVHSIPFFGLNTQFSGNVCKRRARIRTKQSCLTFSSNITRVNIFQVPPDNICCLYYLPIVLIRQQKSHVFFSILFVDSASLDEFEKIVHANANNSHNSITQIMTNIYFSSFVATHYTTSCRDEVAPISAEGSANWHPGLPELPLDLSHGECLGGEC